MKKKLVGNLQNKPQTWLVRGLVSIYSSYGYDITYTRSVLYWTCISLGSVIKNQLLVRTPFGGNNFGQDTQINITAVSKHTCINNHQAIAYKFQLNIYHTYTYNYYIIIIIKNNYMKLPAFQHLL